MLTFIYSRLQLVAFVEFSVYGPLLFMIHPAVVYTFLGLNGIDPMTSRMLSERSTI